MLDIGFSRQLVRINFKDRAIVQGGMVTYRLADKSGHVSLDLAEWRALSAEFDEESRLVVRKAKKWLILLLPAILVFAMTLGQVLPGGGLVIVAAFFLGPPGIYLWQSHRIERIARGIEDRLARRPKAAAPRLPGYRVPRWLEVAVVLLVGPHLILEVYGSIHPEAYRNTPLLGTELDWTSLVSFAVLAAVFSLRWRNAQLSASAGHAGRSPQPERLATCDAPARKNFGRRVDPVAPAREAAP